MWISHKAIRSKNIFIQHILTEELISSLMIRPYFVRRETVAPQNALRFAVSYRIITTIAGAIHVGPGALRLVASANIRTL